MSRCRRIDMTRATVAKVVAHQLDAGSAVVDAVEGHRVLENGSYEFKINGSVGARDVGAFGECVAGDKGDRLLQGAGAPRPGERAEGCRKRHGSWPWARAWSRARPPLMVVVDS